MQAAGARAIEVEGPRCPYCHEALRAGEGSRVGCERCLAWHHRECWEEHGGCSACRAPGVTVTARAATPVLPLALLPGLAISLSGGLLVWFCPRLVPAVAGAGWALIALGLPVMLAGAVWYQRERARRA